MFDVTCLLFLYRQQYGVFLQHNYYAYVYRQRKSTWLNIINCWQGPWFDYLTIMKQLKLASWVTTFLPPFKTSTLCTTFCYHQIFHPTDPQQFCLSKYDMFAEIFLARNYSDWSTEHLTFYFCFVCLVL